MEQKMYINFTIDSEGQCDGVKDFVIDGNEVEIGVDVVNPLIEKLKDVDGFMVSDHKTDVRVWWNGDGTMDVNFRYFNDHEDGDFEDYELPTTTEIVFDHKG